MVAPDSNVVLRVLAVDDPAQCARAEQAWKSAVDASGVFVSLTVVVELARVLLVARKLDLAAIASQLSVLFDSANVTLESEAQLRRALPALESGTTDLSACVILESARIASALPVVTFDERFSAPTDAHGQGGHRFSSGRGAYPPPTTPHGGAFGARWILAKRSGTRQGASRGLRCQPCRSRPP